MGFTMPPVSGVIGIVCAGVGLLFQIVGVATAGWITIDLPPGAGGSIDYGLWEICPPSGSCVDFPIGKFFLFFVFLFTVRTCRYAPIKKLNNSIW